MGFGFQKHEKLFPGPYHQNPRPQGPWGGADSENPESRNAGHRLGTGTSIQRSPEFPYVLGQLLPDTRQPDHRGHRLLEFPYVFGDLLPDSGFPMEMVQLPGNTDSEFPYVFVPELEFPYVMYKMPDFPRFRVSGVQSFRKFWKMGSEFPYVFGDLLPCFGVSRRNVQTASSGRYFKMYFFIFEFCKPFYRVPRHFVHNVWKLQNQRKTWGNSRNVTQCTKT